MKKIFWIAVVCCTVLLPSLPVLAVLQDEAQLDAQIRDIAKTLRCTVCQNESIWDSKAELAHQMREIIRERLIQGQTPEAIRAYFQSRYGDYILLEPRKSGMNWILWAGPFVMFLIGGSLLYRVLRRWVKETPQPRPEELEPLAPHLRHRIDEELRSLD